MAEHPGSEALDEVVAASTKGTSARYLLVTLVILASGLLFGIFVTLLDLSGTMYFSPSSKKNSRATLAQAYDTITIGLPIGEAERNLKTFVKINKNYTLLKNVGGNFYELRSPIEFPRLTWFWVAYFYNDGSHITGKAIRPLDGNFILCGAPPDRGVLPAERKAISDQACIRS